MSEVNYLSIFSRERSYNNAFGETDVFLFIIRYAVDIPLSESKIFYEKMQIVTRKIVENYWGEIRFLSAFLVSRASILSGVVTMISDFVAWKFFFADPALFGISEIFFLFWAVKLIRGFSKSFVNLSNVSFKIFHEFLSHIFFFGFGCVFNFFLRKNSFVKTFDEVAKADRFMSLVFYRVTFSWIGFACSNRFNNAFEISINHEGNHQGSIKILEFKIWVFYGQFNLDIFMLTTILFMLFQGFFRRK